MHVRALLSIAFVLSATGCDPRGGTTPPSQDACNKVAGSWTVKSCHHVVLDGGQEFETPGGTAITIEKLQNEIVVGSGDQATKMTPTERTDVRCAGAGLALIVRSATEIDVERTDPEFRSQCTFVREEKK
jgi:hypothetical protein